MKNNFCRSLVMNIQMSFIHLNQLKQNTLLGKNHPVNPVCTQISYELDMLFTC